jgi:hypothetical protein
VVKGSWNWVGLVDLTFGPTGVEQVRGWRLEVGSDLLPQWDLSVGTKVTQGAWDVVDKIL